jgi:uncharacterized membrane protein YhaH (DUF805 family)
MTVTADTDRVGEREGREPHDQEASHGSLEWATELAIAFGVLWLTYLLAKTAGWNGPPTTPTSTRVWPFYIDPLDTRTVWTARAFVPLAGMLPVLIVLRRWFERGGIGWLLALVGTAYIVQLGCGVERHGVGGLSRTFARPLEYWQDTRYVNGTFLADFPEVGGRLSQHGETHPPGFPLLLAAIRSAGATDPKWAELACSLATPFAALAFFGMARRLTNERTARFAVPLFLFASSVTAFTIMSMDVVVMMLAALSLYGFSRALDGDGWGGLLWGVSLAAASLCTFTALMLVVTFAALIARRWHDTQSLTWFPLVWGPAAFLVSYGVLIGAFGYRPFHVLAASLRAFALSDDSQFRSRSLALLGNPVAFLGALGLPLAGLAARSIGGMVRRVGQRRARSMTLLMAAALLPPAICTLIGKPRGEVEHVFLMFVPMTILAASSAARQWYGRSDDWVWKLAVPCLILQSILVEIFVETYW